MIPAFFIAVRETIEASFVAATILGILTRTNRRNLIRSVWSGIILAVCVSFMLVSIGTFIGTRIHETVIMGNRELYEAVLRVISACFITWAVFFLHTHFSKKKVKFLMHLRDRTEQGSEKAMFLLSFSSIFREGFEIALFLSATYVVSEFRQIITGTALGILAGIALSLTVFAASVRLSVRHAYYLTSALLILFAAGIVAESAHTFTEIGLLPYVRTITIAVLPEATTVAGILVKAVFGISKTMDVPAVAGYLVYSLAMCWLVFFRGKRVRIVEKAALSRE